MKKRRRISKSAHAKRIAAARKTITRLNRSPAFRAANSRRMKRNRADPAFNTLHRAAMQRLHADPLFVKANRERMIRNHADPVFCDRQRVSVSIPPSMRAAIISALNAEPNAKRIARMISGASYSTVLRVAKAAGIELPNNRKLTARQKREAVRRRARGEKLAKIARRFDVAECTISRLVRSRRYQS
jgi:CENP-B N-terminal DNA-binding domain